MTCSIGSLILAAHASSLERLRHIPSSFWVNIVIFLVGIYAVVRLWRTLRKFNDYAPYVACTVFCSGVFFYWVYTRTEPAVLTPVVERLTPFFPTKATQQDAVDQARASRES